MLMPRTQWTSMPDALQSRTQVASSRSGSAFTFSSFSRTVSLQR